MIREIRLEINNETLRHYNKNGPMGQDLNLSFSHFSGSLSLKGVNFLNGDFGVHLISTTGVENSDAETRLGCLIMPISSRFEINIDGNIHPINDGSFFVIPPAKKDVRFLPVGHVGIAASITFDWERLKNDFGIPSNDLFKLSDNGVSSDNFKKSVNRLVNECFTPGNLLIKSLSPELILREVTERVRLLVDDSRPSLRSDPRWIDIHRVKYATDYMKDNYHRSITVKDLSSHCRVSSRSLQTSFRAVYGRTPMKVLEDMRLDAARRLFIELPFPSIKAVAFRCGFNHMGRFSKKYRDKYGILPSDDYSHK